MLQGLIFEQTLPSKIFLLQAVSESFLSGRCIHSKIHLIRHLFTRIRLLGGRYSDSRTAYDYFGSPVAVQNFPFFIVNEVTVTGRCRCNGHASTCDDEGVCLCEHATTGTECQRCVSSHNAAPWAAGVIPLAAINDPGQTHACRACNCSGRAEQCVFDASRYAISGDGSDCRNFCQDNTTGYNCEQCQPGFFKVMQSNTSSTFTCEACRCNLNGSVSSVCDPETGHCSCKTFVEGVVCDQCARGYRTLSAINPDGCTSCNCYQPGTRGLAIDCDEVLGCDCRDEYTGPHCANCVDGFFQTPSSNGDYICQQCNPECLTGCTAAGDNACHSCRNDRFTNGSITRCIASCSSLQNEHPHMVFTSALDPSQCGVCSEQCAGGCDGVGPRACFGCSGVLNSGTCQDACPPFTYVEQSRGVSECTICDAQCDDSGCTGPTSNDCINCRNVESANGTCSSRCEPSEFPDVSTGVGRAPRCTPCDNVCNGCSGFGPTACQSCRSGTFLWRDHPPAMPTCVSACNLSISFVVSNSTTGQSECLACSEQCANGCSGSTAADCSAAGCAHWEQGNICVPQCGAGFFYHHANRTCVPACPSNTHADGVDCMPCTEHCMTCTSGNTCIVCAPEYALSHTSPGTCVRECDAFTYRSNDILNTSAGITSVQRCFPCDSQCSSNCSGAGPSQCDMCRHVELNGVCVSQCPSGYFSSSNRVCEACSEQCAFNCTGPLPTQCSELSPGNHGCRGFLQGNECVAICGSAWFEAPNSTTCGLCHPSCRTCSNSSSNACTSCSTMRYEDGEGHCSPCSSECGGNSSCNGGSPADCLDGCRHIRAVANDFTSWCTATCAFDFYAPNTTTCVQCHPQCGLSGCTGEGPTNCVQCRNASFLGECVSDCPQDWTRMPDGVCVQCHQECRRGQGCWGPLPTQCSACASATFNGECVPRCPNRTWLNHLSCQPCHHLCGDAGCFGDEVNECRNCEVAFHNGRCVSECPSETYLDEQSRECRQCHSECDGCLGPSAFNCNRCRNLQHGTICTATCPTGFYADDSALNCNRCHPECLNCSASGPAACSSCVHAVDMTSGTRVCVSACSLQQFVLSGTTCALACPPDKPYYSDSRVTGTAGECAESCDALNDPRLLSTALGDPFKCTTPGFAHTESNSGTSSSNRGIPRIAVVVVAATVALAALVALVFVIFRRYTRRRSSNLTVEQPQPISPELSTSMRQIQSTPRTTPYTPNVAFARPHIHSPTSKSGTPRSSFYLDVAGSEQIPTDVDDDGVASTSL